MIKILLFILLSSVGTITFKWFPADRAETYNLQVATDKDFSDIVINRPELSDTFYVAELEPGRYYWRVNASNWCCVSDWSEVWSFTLLESMHLNLSPGWIPINKKPKEIME